MAKYRRRVFEIDAQRLKHEMKLVDEEGREKVGRRGDWLVTGAMGHQYIIDADVFAMSYEPVEDGDR